MTREERAAQIWPLIVFAAKNRQLLTYDVVARLIGVPRPAVGGFLEPIQAYCMKNDLPALTSLIVSEISGQPGEGFIAHEDVPKAQAEVFKFDWFKIKPPSAEELG